MEPLWDQVVGHFIEVIAVICFYLYGIVLASYAIVSMFLIFLQLAVKPNQNLRNIALDALDRSICAVLGSDHLENNTPTGSDGTSQNVRTFTSLFLVATYSIKYK